MTHASPISLTIAIAIAIMPLANGARTALAETVAQEKLAEIVATGGNGEIVYAETPSALVIPIGVPPVPQLIVRSGFAILEGQVLQSQGKKISAEGKVYHYVAPLEAGTTIEGVFVRQGGGGMTVGSTTVTKSETLTFAFDSTGRFSMAKDLDIAITTLSAGGGSSSDGSAAGTYRLSGYTLELQPDQGTLMKLPFFAYTIDPFWPTSQSSGDRVNALNLDGELFYRDKGEK